MNLERRRSRLDRRIQMAGSWRAPSVDGAENALFDRCFEFAEAARELERVAGAPGSGGAAAASMGCMTSGFESLANAVLMMRAVALRELPEADEGESEPAERERLGRLLFAIDQNLRFAAEAADLARQTAGEALARAS